MEYNIEFQVSALIMLAMLMGVFFSKKRYASFDNRIYVGLLITALIAAVTDIASVITLAEPEHHPLLTIALGHLYLLVMLVFIVHLCVYTVLLTGKGSFQSLAGRKKLLLTGGILAMAAAMIISSLLKLYPVGSGRYAYTIGPSVSFTYAVGGMAVVFLFLYTFRHRHQTTLKRQIPIYAYVIIEAITALIQKFNPYILLSTFAMVVVLFFMYFTLENPDMKMIQALHDAMEEAQKADQAKNAFLANMSHEFRTPINAILGMDEMILRESESEHITEYATNIKSAGNALLSLVNDVLDFSKIESGKMEITEREYQLTQMLRDSLSLIEMKAEQKSLSVITQVQKDLPCVLSGDEVHIRQILTGLMSNAVKYTEKGTVTLQIGGQKISDKTVLLQVSVADTGVGIRPEDIQRLTEAFERLEVKNNRSVAGVGLGLSITTGLLNMMGSRLQVSSGYGKGSVFSFELLQKVVDWEPVGDMFRYDRNEMKTGEGRKTLCAEKARILVTDDNALNLSVVRGLLKRTGVQLTTAASGMETIDFVTKEHFDLVFLDHMMPQMDGIETFQRICRLWDNGQPLETTRETPFIVLTANAVTGAREMYLKKGFTDYLSKPVEAENLEYMLKKYLPGDLWTEMPDKRSTKINRQANLDDAGLLGKETVADQAIRSKMATCFCLLWEERMKRLLAAVEQRNVQELRILIRELSVHSRALDTYTDAVRMRHLLHKLQIYAQEGREDELLQGIASLVEIGTCLMQELEGEIA